MGSGQSKSFKRKVTRLLIPFCAVSLLTYVLCNYYAVQAARARELRLWTSPASAGQVNRHDAIQSQQRPEKLRNLILGSDDAPHQAQEAIADPSPNASLLEPSSTSGKQAIIGKVTISFGGPDEVFDRAIRSHELHNRNMGYAQYVLRERVMSGLWSKHAYIFSVIVQELAKPEAERLQWIMWLDRDTVLMNPLLRLEEFLPPPGFEKIHLLATNDRHGLNNGVFLLRVNDWALKLFHNALAFHHYRPDIKLNYSEQSAMEEVLKEPWYKASTAMVPQHWFNSFPPPSGKEKWTPGRHARPGSLLIHFASDRDGLRPQRMTDWMDIADKLTPEWNVPFDETHYPGQIEEYWKRRGAEENVEDIVRDLEKRALTGMSLKKHG